jgi:hypothetical protein
MLHGAADGEGAGQQAGGGGGVAVAQGVADTAGGDDALRILHRSDGAGFHADLGAQRGEGGDIALAALAEGEVGAGDDARRADGVAQHGVHPIMRRGGGEVAGEVEDQHGIGPGGAKSSCRWSSVVRRKGAASGAKMATGCGSKVATMAGRPSALAQRIASPTTA